MALYYIYLIITYKEAIPLLFHFNDLYVYL